MKFVIKSTAILIISLTFTSIVKADSISEQDLQQRFNKAFRVFNGQDGYSESNFSEMTKDAEKKEETDKVSLSNSDKNISKKSNKVKIEENAIETPAQLTFPAIKMKSPFESHQDLTSLQERLISIDMQNATLKQIVDEALKQASNGQKWSIRWRLKDENKYIIKERINLTAELNFDDFIGNMISTITNITGIILRTKVFNQNKIIIITDSF